ncbi:uncharacterized protein Z519_12206 [Cladophialophora bantiana CBS 173.52]|uniref:Uncharacterized protein n=1 Tax=Cladophialophora bantiana (strain ATCC 10958 / CBS 173.52 / CDC B-1940 / NIH 8579) TaxID=1442370 RepID=A0A0D2H8A3_CLAB1|nr:uncharacterized protein Z519_12206 [Cladophialophora bantiana CBS 173.52]KIW87095.1 hypothetical protein Z519_12206 [Cladophialophora bantiana CBS 173.52]
MTPDSSKQENQLLEEELTERATILEHLQHTVHALEGQIDQAIQQKDEADPCVANVEEYNRTLLLGFANKHALNPREIEELNICKSNEWRNLRQAFEMSQHTCAELVAANEELVKAADDQNEQESQFREDSDVLKKKMQDFLQNFRS